MASIEGGKWRLNHIVSSSETTFHVGTFYTFVACIIVLVNCFHIFHIPFFFSS